MAEDPNIKVSIIIPVYNVEREIKRCIESIVAQTLSQIEVILVDDYSTDNSIAIAKTIFKDDPRFKVVRNEKNIGLGLSRNVGLNIARGSYVGFIDSDDYIECTMFERLYLEAKNSGLDIVGSNFEYCYEDGSRKRNILDVNSFYERGVEYLIESLLYADCNGFIPNSMCDKIYNREFLRYNNLWVVSEREVFLEDLLFNFFTFKRKPKVGWVNETFYYYAIRSGSTLYGYKRNLVDRYLRMYNSLLDNIPLDDLKHSHYKLLIKKSLFNYVFVFLSNALRGESTKATVDELVKIYRSDEIFSVVKEFSYKDIPRSRGLSISGILKVIFYFVLRSRGIK